MTTNICGCYMCPQHALLVFNSHNFMRYYNYSHFNDETES